jgi:uncharacterized protein (DUF1499 family)
MMFLWGLAFAMLLGIAYVRFAPSDASKWHVPPVVQTNEILRYGVKRRVTLGGGALKKFSAVALLDPRTQVLAGSTQEGMMTFITRSRVIGFPDYTTALLQGDDLLVFARLRFGKSDTGVNAARVDRWIAMLTAN